MIDVRLLKIYNSIMNTSDLSEAKTTVTNPKKETMFGTFIYTLLILVIEFIVIAIASLYVVGANLKWNSNTIETPQQHSDTILGVIVISLTVVIPVAIWLTYYFSHKKRPRTLNFIGLVNALLLVIGLVSVFLS